MVDGRMDDDDDVERDGGEGWWRWMVEIGVERDGGDWVEMDGGDWVERDGGDWVERDGEDWVERDGGDWVVKDGRNRILGGRGRMDGWRR
ncbi:hypothetical protein Pmani_008529 [Petrolisthes manimaculis]|uniref:Uncharacterized protein n=1 Tax=Petrolisthes manimaculis TaxID=1843537 RepID=A0AAE1Q649_9EUCA|nr:hypothetical protein Pmani_008529 [Petrolisthes manimaculis]